MKAGHDLDKPKEACGVFGLYAPGEDVSRLIYFGLYALQHRGQESAGIAVTSGSEINCYKDMGLVNLVFNENILRLLKGTTGIGHVRYSTTGSSIKINSQPIHSRGEREVAVAHNGNLINTSSLRAELESNGLIFKSTSDTELISEMIAKSTEPTAEAAVESCLEKLKGAFSLVILTENKLFAIRDELGMRPLCIGTLGDNKWVVASESCAFGIIGAKFVRQVEPGEMVIIEDGKLTSKKYKDSKKEALCIFEYIYFARPDSIMLGQSLYNCRKRLGANLAKEVPTEADVVISVPDSGTPAAIGYAHETGIPFEQGLIKNRYVGRTFIQPDQNMRDLGVKIKLNPLMECIEGKRVIMVDDSIVRGSTSRQIIKMLYNCGAKEVHVRVSCPPVKNPCYYGIDMATSEELLASSRSVEEIREILGCDSIAYLSINGMINATGSECSHFCKACFDGEYPIKIPHQLALDKLVFEKQS
ncbi:MAG TPA: amidophosphoribosyltransferase [bacterium]|nr:amidophosphoribosyltransferase [bacterium]